MRTMGKQQQQQPVQWVQAPDGSWHQAVPAPTVTVNNDGCLKALGVLFVVFIVLPALFVIGVMVIGAASGPSKPKPVATTTTSTTVR